jgi:hypothetical protein
MTKRRAVDHPEVIALWRQDPCLRERKDPFYKADVRTPKAVRPPGRHTPGLQGVANFSNGRRNRFPVCRYCCHEAIRGTARANRADRREVSNLEALLSEAP